MFVSFCELVGFSPASPISAHWSFLKEAEDPDEGSGAELPDFVDQCAYIIRHYVLADDPSQNFSDGINTLVDETQPNLLPIESIFYDILTRHRPAKVKPMSTPSKDDLFGQLTVQSFKKANNKRS
jgi:hypothetical protein